MSNFEDLITGRDLLFATLTECQRSASEADEYAVDTKRYIREAYWKILPANRWEWALSSTPGVITTVAKVTGSVNSISSATVTLSASITDSMTGRKFYMDANQGVYRISAHTAGTATLTLDGSYVETETSGPFTIYQDEYSVSSDVLKVWDPFQVRGQWWQEVPILDKPIFENFFGKGWSAGPAPLQAATEVQRDTNGGRTFRFGPWSETAVSVEYDYTKFDDLDFSGVAATDTPKVPRPHRHSIVELAASKLWRHLDNTNNANNLFTMYEMTMADMISHYLGTAHEAQFQVKMRNSLALGCN